MLKLGTDSIGKLYLGTDGIAKAYLGTELVYEKDSGTPVTTWSVSLSGNTYVTDNAPATVNDGSSLSVTLTPKTFCAITAASVTMGGDAVSDAVTANADGTYSIAIASVTDDVSISVTAHDYNVAYKNVRYDPSSSGKAYLSVGYSSPYAVTKLYDLGAERDAAVGITFSIGTYAAAKKDYKLLLFNSDGVYASYYGFTSTGRQVSISTSYRYVALAMPLNDIASCYIKYTSSGEYLFNGSTFDTDDLHLYTEFMETHWWPKPNSNGDYMNAILVNPSYTYGYMDSQLPATHYAGAQSSKNYSICQVVGVNRANVDLLYGVSALFEFTDGASIEFSAGGTGSLSSSSRAPYISLRNNPDTTGSVGDYFGASSNPRTVTKASTTCGRVVFRISEYSGAYAKVSGSSENLWQALQS